MILSKQAQTIIEAVRSISTAQLNQNTIHIQTMQNIETGQEKIVITTSNTNCCPTEDEHIDFYQIMDDLNIPVGDIAEGAEYVAQFIRDNPFSDENRANYFVMMAISAYHAGKHANE